MGAQATEEEQSKMSSYTRLAWRHMQSTLDKAQSAADWLELGRTCVTPILLVLWAVVRRVCVIFPRLSVLIHFFAQFIVYSLTFSDILFCKEMNMVI